MHKPAIFFVFPMFIVQYLVSQFLFHMDSVVYYKDEHEPFYWMLF